MKKLITILSVTFFFIFSFMIKANAHEGTWYPGDNRSISIFLSIEKNDLHIYSDKQWNNIGIQMIDPNGRTIYMDVITIPSENELVIPLSDLSQGNYQVVLTKNNQPVIWYLTK